MGLRIEKRGRGLLVLPLQSTNPHSSIICIRNMTFKVVRQLLRLCNHRQGKAWSESLLNQS